MLNQTQQEHAQRKPYSKPDCYVAHVGLVCLTFARVVPCNSVFRICIGSPIICRYQYVNIALGKQKAHACRGNTSKVMQENTSKKAFTFWWKIGLKKEQNKQQ